MKKNSRQTIIFILANGIWKNVSGDSETLADFLSKYKLIIDDRTQYAGICDNEKGIYILYKVVNAIKIQVDIWTLETH